ncbi:MAG: hypothetical protein U0R44_01675 [Candidatus Micrarchaeia archaeon]
MKAAQINGYGDSRVIVVKDIPKPTASPGKIVVGAYAAALNPFDPEDNRRIYAEDGCL